MRTISVISVRNFSKSFGNKQVVNDLSFDVQPGEIFAFLGANGSGKTTTIRSLLGLLPADSGELLVFGKPYTTDQSKDVGYLPEERGLYTSANVLEVMTFVGSLKGMTAADAKSWSQVYLAEVGLEGHAISKIKQLSSGQQQKVQLGITIMNKPKLLILDEPTKGLDPVNQELLMSKLKEMNRQGSTIVFITHQMNEVEEIANRLVMIRKGEKVLYGDVAGVKAHFGDNSIHVEFSGAFPQNEKLYAANVETNTAEVHPRDGVTPQDVLKALTGSGLKLTTFKVAAPSLQEIFVKVERGDVHG